MKTFNSKNLPDGWKRNYNDLTHTLEVSGYKFNEIYVARDITIDPESRLDKEKRLDLIDMFYTLNSEETPEDYTETHVICEIWSHDVMPEFFLPVNQASIERRLNNQISDQIFRITNDNGQWRRILKTHRVLGDILNGVTDVQLSAS